MSKMNDSTQEKIIGVATQEVAKNGCEGMKIRSLSHKVGVAPSVLYYHFSNKQELLDTMYTKTDTSLGVARSLLPQAHSFPSALIQRIHFQFDHAEEIMAVLKYYMYFRKNFQKNERGYLPEKTYLHIEEILAESEKNGEYSFPHRAEDAKIIVHAINGFLFEYYPEKIAGKEKSALVDTIQSFILRSLSPYKI